jgi:hypothetical protein
MASKKIGSTALWRVAKCSTYHMCASASRRHHALYIEFLCLAIFSGTTDFFASPSSLKFGMVQKATFAVNPAKAGIQQHGSQTTPKPRPSPG